MTPTQRKSGLRLPWSHDEETGDADATQTSGGIAAEGPSVTNAAETEPAPAAAPAPAGDATPATTAASQPPEGPDSALLASLVTAMRDVAEREREGSLAGLRARVDEAVEHLRKRGAEGADTLRSQAETDIAEIGEWVRSETERIGAEGERKIEARRQQLTQQLTDHEQRGQREVESLHARFDEYNRELDAFFAQLNEIDDPAAFGAAAKRLPRPPVVAVKAEPEAPPVVAPQPAATAAADAATSAGDATEIATAEATSAVEATAEATSAEATSGEPTTAKATGAETTVAAATETADETAAENASETTLDVTTADVPSADVSTAETETAEPETTAEAAPSDVVGEAETPVEREAAMVESHRFRLDALGLGAGSAATSAEEGEAPTEETEPSQAAYADPLRARLAELDARLGPDETDEPAAAATGAAGGEVATAIVVNGLGSFGAITSFKQALERVEGVRGISLSLGPTGEFVYRATHDTGFDLVAAIEQIERGQAQVDRQADGSLRVTVQRSR